MPKIAIRFYLDPLDEVIEVLDLNTNFRYGGAAYVECENRVEILSLFICEEYRGKGIGTALMQFVLEYFRKEIRLGVLNENKDAQRFYTRLGFKYLRRIRTGEAHFLIKERKEDTCG